MQQAERQRRRDFLRQTHYSRRLKALENNEKYWVQKTRVGATAHLASRLSPCHRDVRATAARVWAHAGLCCVIVLLAAAASEPKQSRLLRRRMRRGKREWRRRCSKREKRRSSSCRAVSPARLTLALTWSS